MYQILDQLSHTAHVVINAPPALVVASSNLSFRMTGQLSEQEWVTLLRDSFEKSDGVFFDPQPDGTWQARVVPASGRPTSFVLVINTIDLEFGVRMADGQPLRAVDELISWATGKTIFNRK